MSDGAEQASRRSAAETPDDIRWSLAEQRCVESCISEFLRRHLRVPIDGALFATRRMLSDAVPEARKINRCRKGLDCLCHEEAIFIICAIRMSKMTLEPAVDLAGDWMHDFMVYLRGLS